MNRGNFFDVKILQNAGYRTRCMYQERNTVGTCFDSCWETYQPAPNIFKASDHSHIMKKHACVCYQLCTPLRLADVQCTL